MTNDKDMRIVTRMMAITAISNVSDTLVFYLESSAGIFPKIMVFISGSWLFMGNVLIGYNWARFLTMHMNIPFSDTRRKAYLSGGVVAFILLVINVFYPLVFSNSNGEYQRGPAYSAFLVLAFLYILDSMYLYVKCRKRIDTLKLFPVQVFLVPVFVGIVIQAMFIEVSITWTSIAIAIAGILTALKNETIFMDHLTGLYNRVYLEFLQKQSYNKKSKWVSGVMADLNGFKDINDRYGHAEGDVALITAGEVLKRSFAEYGVVTRYAGDEFIIMLNTTDEQLVQRLIDKTKENFEAENKKSYKPYSLSVSMGYAITDLRVETMDAFMNRIDRRMYQDKSEYYNRNENDRRKG